MRRICIAPAVVAIALAAYEPTIAGMKEDCVQDHSQDLTIAGCSEVIRSGQWSGKDLAWAYYNRGNAYRNLGDHHRAIEDYDQAISLDPGFADAHHNRGRAHENLGEHNRAIQDYDQAISLDPRNADAHQNRGVAYESLGEYERAARDWELAIRIDGASRAIRWQKYLKGKGHYSGAIDGIAGPVTKRGLLACARDSNC